MAKTWGIISSRGSVISLTNEDIARKYCDEWNNSVDGMATGRPYRVAQFVELTPIDFNGGFSITLPDGGEFTQLVVKRAEA